MMHTKAHAKDALIALGSNLPSPAGGPVKTIRAAVRALGDLGRVAAVSSLYYTEPVGVVDQPIYTNAAAVLQTTLAPETLLEKLLAIERTFGRDRSAQAIPSGPRTLDLDLLMLADAVIESPTLTLPHPSLARRRFVLLPLAEIAPNAVHPILHKTVAELLAALPQRSGEQEPARLPAHQHD